MRLRDNVFMTIADGRFVFLDLDRDRYSALDSKASRRFAALWPELDEQNEADFTTILQRAGLAATASCGSRAEVFHHPQPETDLARSASTAIWHAPRALISRAWAAHRIARTPLDSIVRARRLYRTRWRERASPERAIAAASIHIRTTPLLNKNGKCLLNALSLLGFLGPAGSAADWVFAVRGQPFEAHCWVQCGTTVLNDTIEGVAGYHPIMTV